jgi:hypothetical protein
VRRKTDVQSIKALKWLVYLERTLDLTLDRAGGPTGEKIILERKVDGYDAATSTVYQYHG